LPDLELRRRVAEVLGWTQLHKWGENIDGIPPGSPDTDANIRSVPAYELDIAAAWGLLEGLRYDVDNTTDAPDVCVILWLEDGTPTSAIAPTAPRAICLAYLAWKESSDAK
jgi:hypothetical protein